MCSVWLRVWALCPAAPLLPWGGGGVGAAFGAAVPVSLDGGVFACVGAAGWRRYFCPSAGVPSGCWAGAVGLPFGRSLFNLVHGALVGTAFAVCRPEMRPWGKQSPANKKLPDCLATKDLEVAAAQHHRTTPCFWLRG